MMEEYEKKAFHLFEYFNIDGKAISVKQNTNGHINRTFVLTAEMQNGITEKFVIQRINTNVFKNPVELMDNIVGVTSYLRGVIAENGGDVNRETLTFVKTKSGRNFHTDREGGCWRMYHYIDNVTSYNIVERPILFENSAKAFGHFQKQLAAYPADTLHETIVQFHDTVKRFRDFKEAIANDIAGRAASVQAEIRFYLDRENICDCITSRLASGEIPLRVTHNDTKLNNILMDNETDLGVCVIDLDTVMPGSALYDFGDSIRFGASSALEDEKDLSKVHFVLGLFEAYTRGFLSEAKDTLNDCEKDLLPVSGIMMTYECGMRFLTDYLNGDTYFGIQYPEHNLDRTRTQMKLVAEMEEQMDTMKKIVEKYR